MTQFVAKQVQPNIPIWTLFAGDTDIGCMTNFEGEGPMATVRNRAAENEFQVEISATVSAPSIHETLVKAKEAWLTLLDPQRNVIAFPEEFIEDEDGERARQIHEERVSEEWAMRADMQEPF